MVRLADLVVFCAPVAIGERGIKIVLPVIANGKGTKEAMQWKVPLQRR